MLCSVLPVRNRTRTWIPSNTAKTRTRTFPCCLDCCALTSFQVSRHVLLHYRREFPVRAEVQAYGHVGFSSYDQWLILRSRGPLRVLPRQLAAAWQRGWKHSLVVEYTWLTPRSISQLPAGSSELWDTPATRGALAASLDYHALGTCSLSPAARLISQVARGTPCKFSHSFLVMLILSF